MEIVDGSGCGRCGVLAIAGQADAGSLKGKVTGVENGGRVVKLAGQNVKVSGSRTKVMIGGQEADRSDVKAGMTCTAETKDNGEATTLNCRK